MDQMTDRHHGVVPDHARAGITHDFLDALAHLGVVAVNCAVLAGGFFKAEGAFFQSFFRIGPDSGTLIT